MLPSQTAGRSVYTATGAVQSTACVRLSSNMSRSQWRLSGQSARLNRRSRKAASLTATSHRFALGFVARDICSVIARATFFMEAPAPLQNEANRRNPTVAQRHVVECSHWGRDGRSAAGGRMSMPEKLKLRVASGNDAEFRLHSRTMLNDCSSPGGTHWCPSS